ncbi:MAG: sulfite exporter TauE/SafE family protein [Spirosomataceae bacterium]
MELLGYSLAIMIGLLLSLLGGGGSILTVPVLVYVFGIEPALATAYSLFIVGVSSLVGSVNYLRQGLASSKTALFFSFPSFVMVYVMRKIVVPQIPAQILTLGSFVLSKNVLIMLVFAVTMVLASSSMIRGRRDINENLEELRKQLNYPLIFVEGLLVGTLTGFVGVGGGFLIIPVLTVMLNLPMKFAVGTSLMIITINSLMGFLGDLGNHSIDWQFVGQFVGLSIIGVFIGGYLSKFLSNKQLKPAFGWFTLLMGIGILLRELVLKP